jgi:hypothetical protein
MSHMARRVMGFCFFLATVMAAANVSLSAQALGNSPVLTTAALSPWVGGGTGPIPNS